MEGCDIPFTKMHGIGNDYLYLNCLAETPADLPSLSIEMSDRHTGIGSDGIILICPGGEQADFKMRIFNADGSEAMMCGNGIRCVGKYVYDKKLTDNTELHIDTLSGIKILKLHKNESGEVSTVTVDMGAPVLKAREVPVVYSDETMIEGKTVTSKGTVEITAVSMGNPHGVIFTDDLSDSHVLTTGPELETNPIWPNRANIEFARVDSPDHITMRVWERGSGETMACGTGACAVAVAGAITGRTNRKVTVSLRGGDLEIEWREDGHVYMRGSATTIADGIYYRKYRPSSQSEKNG